MSTATHTIDHKDGFEFRVSAGTTPPLPPAPLWGPYLTPGTIAVLDGDPGAGKTFLAIDLAARLTAGKPMPDGSPGPDLTGGHHVMLINVEDSVDKILTPRFVAAGGDLSRLRFFGGLTNGRGAARPPQFPRDQRRLLQSLLKESASLVILDSISGLFPKNVSINSDQTIREQLLGFARIAEWTNSVLLFTRHLNKTAGRRAVYRGTGSIGITGVARSVLLAGRHPDYPDRRVLAHVKNNLGPEGPSLTYRLITTGGVPTVAWDGPTNLTADDLCRADPAPEGASEIAEKWLRELLANGPVLSAAVEAEAQKSGISFATLRLVKKKTGIESRLVVRDGERFWEWLPPRAFWDLAPITG